MGYTSYRVAGGHIVPDAGVAAFSEVGSLPSFGNGGAEFFH
jgi:hypothetical protein